MHGLTRLYLCACETEGCLANSELVRFFTELEQSSFDGENGSASLFASSIFKNKIKNKKDPQKNLLSSTHASAADAASDASQKKKPFHRGTCPADIQDAASEQGGVHSYSSQSSRGGGSSGASKKEVASLPSVAVTFLVGSPNRPITMDLSKNYLGDAGTAAVFRVLPLLRWVTRVNARGCGAGTQAVKALCDVLTMELPISTAPTSRPSPTEGGDRTDQGESAAFCVRSSVSSSVALTSSSSSTSAPQMCFGMPLLPLEVIDLRQNPLFAASARLLCHALKTRHRLTQYYRQKMTLCPPHLSASPASSLCSPGRSAAASLLPSYHSGMVEMGTTPVEIRAVEVLVDDDGFPPSMASTLRELQQAAHAERQARGLKYKMKKEEEEMKLFSVYSPGGGRASGEEEKAGGEGGVAGSRQPTGEHLIYRIPEYAPSFSGSPLVLPNEKDETVDEEEEKRRSGKGSTTSSSALDTLPEVFGVEGKDSQVLSPRPSAASLQPFYDVSNPHLCRVVREMNQHMESYLVAFRCLSTRHTCLPPQRRKKKKPHHHHHNTRSSGIGHALHEGWETKGGTSTKETTHEEGEEEEDDGESDDVDDDEESGCGIQAREERVEQALAAAELCVDLGADTLAFLPLTTAAVWYTPEEEEGRGGGTHPTAPPMATAAPHVTPSIDATAEEDGTPTQRRWCAELHHHVGTLLRGFYANSHLESELEMHRGPLLVTYIAQLKEMYYATTMALPVAFREGGVESDEKRDASAVSPLERASSTRRLRPLLPQLYQLEVLYDRVVAALATRRMSDLPSMAHVEDRLQEIRSYMLDFLLLGTTDVSSSSSAIPPQQSLPVHTTSEAKSSSPCSSSLLSSVLPSIPCHRAAEGKGVLPVWCAEMKYFLWNEAAHQHEWNTVLVPRERQHESGQGSSGSLASFHASLANAEKRSWWGTHEAGEEEEEHSSSRVPRMWQRKEQQKTSCTPAPDEKVEEQQKKKVSRTATGIPPKYRSLLQCRCPRPPPPCAPSSPLSRLVVLSCPVDGHAAAAAAPSSSAMACRSRWADRLPRPCPSCCHAALSILPTFFRDPVVLRRMVLQQKLRDVLPMEMKLFFLDMVVQRRSQTGYIPRVFGVGTRLWSPEMEALRPAGENIKEEEKKNNTQNEEEAPQKRSALQRLLDDWASPESVSETKRMGAGGRKEGKESPSDNASLPPLPRRQLVSVMDFFAAVDGKPERMGELLASFEEWYRLMMVECFDVGHPPRLSLPSASN